MRVSKGIMTALALGIALFLTACGERAEEQPSQESSVQLEDIVRDGVIDYEKENQWLGIDSSELETSEEEPVPENVILIGALSGDYSALYKIVSGFQKYQKEYKAEIKKYEDRDAMFLDLVRGKGCDILALTPTYLTVLSDKGALEDLTPYFEGSDVVKKEDLFAGVWETGMAGERMAGVMPEFFVQGILTQKGSTEGGGWTVEEYLALADRYPDVPLSKNADPEKGWFWIYNELSGLPEAFVDWEGRTCDFESEDFVQSMERLKDCLESCRKAEYDSNAVYNAAELLHGRQVQTQMVAFGGPKRFYGYKQLRDTFFDTFELAGFPNPEGDVRYPIADSPASRTIICGINSASAKKTAAWLFLEYMLSEEYQMTVAESSKQPFPVRRDLVERLLSEEIEADPEDMSVGYINSYTGETVRERGEFTEEDKEAVLYILDHAAPPDALSGGGEFKEILLEEIQAFFAGDKTAQETARVLQSRISIYLSE